MNIMKKKKDFIFALVLVILVMILSLFMIFRKNSHGENVYIQINGENYGVYSLYDNQEIEIENERGKNIVKIEAGKVNMIYADCPDQYCVFHAPIHDSYEPIVCLPHRLVVEIK